MKEALDLLCFWMLMGLLAACGIWLIAGISFLGIQVLGRLMTPQRNRGSEWNKD